MDTIKTEATDAFKLSDAEREALLLWDQSQELQLERTLLEIQSGLSVASLSSKDVEAELVTAEKAFLEARTTYMLRNNITTNVLIADPILKSVHEASSANSIERRLLPLIHERDAVVLAHSHLSSKLRALRHQYSGLEAEIMKLNGENQALASQLLKLTDALKDQTVEELDDPRLTAELEGLDETIKKARRRWRVMKSLVAGVVVGSGVEWSRRPELLELVLDDEDEGREVE